jgi:hypothetical protein
LCSTPSLRTYFQIATISVVGTVQLDPESRPSLSVSSVGIILQ